MSPTIRAGALPRHAAVPGGDPRRSFTALDFLWIVLVVYAVPAVILAIGIPIGLFVRLVARIVGAL